MVFDELFEGFIENIKEGVLGKEWAGEFVLGPKGYPPVFPDSPNGF